MGLKVNPPPKFLKDWEVKANNTSYLAEADGFVCAIPASASSLDIKLLTDINDPPVTIRQRQYIESGPSARQLSVSGPVKKGHYWKVTGADTVFWIPFNY